MDFLEKLKALIGMSGSQTPPQTPPGGVDPNRPWDSPFLRAAPPVAAPAAPQPSPNVMSPMEDAIRQAILLEKQRKVASEFLPEQMWNK